MAINENQIKQNITKQVQNEIDRQRQSINNNIGIQKKQYDETINRNKSYLNEQVGKLKTDRIVNDDKITTLQNRRGGFYSGGLDYQLAENLRNTQNSQSAITRDINDKNQAILGEYNTIASQAANQIKQLEMQAPDTIRQRVNEELQKLRQLQMEEERWALEKQLKQLQIQQQRSGGSRSGGGSRSSGSSSKQTPIAQQYNEAKSKSSSPNTLIDKYYTNQRSELNKGRSLARRPVEEIFPNLIASPQQNKNLNVYERNKLILSGIRNYRPK
jgi:hypothetical protein